MGKQHEINLEPGDVLVVTTEGGAVFEIKSEIDEYVDSEGIQVRGIDDSSSTPLYAKLRSHDTIELY